MSTILDYQPLPPPPGILSRVTDLFRRRATWVLIDQAIVSAGNFLTVNLLARWLPASEFGLLSVMLETMLYLNSLQAALVIYPLSIRGATAGDRQAFGRLASASMLLTVLLLPILGLAMGASVGLMKGGVVIVSAVAALLLWQIQETTRRALMADHRFAGAVCGDAVSYLGQAALIAVLYGMGMLTLNTAFLTIGLTSALGIVVQSLQLGLKPVGQQDVKGVARDFWALGRWMLLNNGCGLITSLAYWWVLKWKHGDAECAAFAVIVATLKLANPIMGSIGSLIVPSVARTHANEGLPAARRIALKYSALGAAMIGPFFLALLIAPEFMLRLFYGVHTPYVEHSMSLRLYVLDYSMAYIATVIGAWLAGLGHSKLSFYTQSVNVIMTLLVGLPMTIRWGVEGLVIGGLIAVTSTAIASAYYLRRLGNQHAASGAGINQ